MSRISKLKGAIQTYIGWHKRNNQILNLAAGVRALAKDKIYLDEKQLEIRCNQANVISE